MIVFLLTILNGHSTSVILKRISNEFVLITEDSLLLQNILHLKIIELKGQFLMLLKLNYDYIL